MTAMPVMIGALCVLAIAYRYYSKFIAQRVVSLDDSHTTPAYEFSDGKNYHPTNKWVLFGHHFAAISGAGPLIGPVLAAQFGYLPGLLWILIGVCLAGAVQDFVVLAASMRRGGRSLAQIAYSEIGKFSGITATIAILFILVIAMAGLGKVVVKALGGESTKVTTDTTLVFTSSESPKAVPVDRGMRYRWTVPVGTEIEDGAKITVVEKSFDVETFDRIQGTRSIVYRDDGVVNARENLPRIFLPAGSLRIIPGSSWGTFTIACTIPIALLVGLWMYKIRPGRVVEASIIGGVLTLVATFVGGIVSQSSYAHVFNLSASGVTWWMAAYGFIASVLPVWFLLCPRDYLSSFLKIGTIGLLVVGVIVANPKLEAPSINHAFFSGGPVLGPTATIFPFMFITIMCGAISGFHALVSSGTTPKMIRKESDARVIGYGAMLVEGLVGIVAMIAAAALPVGDYYAMNTAIDRAPAFHDKFVQIGADIDHLGGPDGYESRTQESLRGRTGGAVTLAVGFAHIFDGAIARFGEKAQRWTNTMWKYWYHFAIMFEALFILTTIDTGTRIGRFLLQEIAGKIHPSLGIRGGWLSAIVCTAVIVLGWVWFLQSDSFDVIWRIFGIANQMLAVIALAIASVYLINSGKAKYLAVTILPMLFVATTTSSAGALMLKGHYLAISTQLEKAAGTRDIMLLVNTSMQAALILGLLACGAIVIGGMLGAIVRTVKPE